MKKGTLKLSEKAGRKLGEKAVDSFFPKKSSLSDGGAELLSQKPVESENKDLYKSPEESGHKIYEILSPASNMKPEMKINKKDSEEIKKIKKNEGSDSKRNQ